jgi:hypothetical protein
MAMKRTLKKAVPAKKAAPGRKARPNGASRPGPQTSRATRAQTKGLTSPYPAPPLSLAGKWVAWSRDHRIIASGDTLADILKTVALQGIRGVSYERLPDLGRDHVRG